MNKISLEEFIKSTQGHRINVPWQEHNGSLAGQCVSLIQQYILHCLNQEAKARGNAKDWIETYVDEGLGVISDILEIGDILVFPNEGIIDGIPYGHMAIYVGDDKIYDQNNYRHDNGLSGITSLFSDDYVILKPKSTLIYKENDNSNEENNLEKYSPEYILQLTKRTIRGDFGNGEKRKQNLSSLYDIVQYQVEKNYENGTINWDDVRLY